jgi:hypothetical protein
MCAPEKELRRAHSSRGCIVMLMVIALTAEPLHWNLPIG